MSEQRNLTRRLSPHERGPSTRGRKPASIDLEQLEKLARLGHTQREIARWFGVERRTLEYYLANEDQPEFREAYDRGISERDARLRALQWRHASGTGMSAVAMTMHMSAHLLGEHPRSINVDGGDSRDIEIGEARELIDSELDRMSKAITVPAVDITENGADGPSRGNGSLLGNGSDPKPNGGASGK